MTDRANAKPRILFYLPVVTPWWFTNIIAPLIRAADKGGEVHVLVPPMWSCTGIEAHHLAECMDMEDVAWHILDNGNHPDLRFPGVVHADVVQLVREIDPDLSLCRSADLDTPSAFPGVVRYIMEGGAPPFVSGRSVYLGNTLYDHGIVPQLTSEQDAWLTMAFAEAWAERKAGMPQMGRAEFLAQTGLPADKLLIAMPLEYEHDEMFFDQHNLFANNIELIDALAGALADDAVLVISRHPINENCGHRELLEAVDRHGGKVRMIEPFGERGEATTVMTRHCDGLIVGNSKCFAITALYGRPMLRLTKFETGAWLNVYSDLTAFVDAIRAGTARTAAEKDAIRWSAYHIGNSTFMPTDLDLDAARIVDYAVNPFSPARWEKGLDRFLPADISALPSLDMAEEMEDLPLAVGM